MAAHRKWTDELDTIVVSEMEGRGSRTVEAVCAALSGLTDFRQFTATAIEKRYHKLHSGRVLRPDTRISQKLHDDKRPLVEVLFLLDQARPDAALWGKLFPRAMAAVEAVLTDVADARSLLAEMEPIYLANKRATEDRLVRQMEEAEAALQREKLVDRKIKKEV